MVIRDEKKVAHEPGINDIEWDMTSLHTEACLGYTSAKLPTPIPIPKLMWSAAIPGMKAGDQVVLLYSAHTPLLVTPIVGGVTLKAMFRSIQRGMRVPVVPKHAKTIIKKLSLEENYGKTLMMHANKGMLRPWHLLGDHRFFEGNLRRGNDGVWTYMTGS